MITATTPRFNTVTFSSNNDDKDKRKVTTSEVATATGATGAAAGGLKAKSGAFDMFKSSGKVGRITQNTARAIQNTRKPLRQVKGFFPKFTQTFKNTKADILKWADGVKNSNILKPLLKSKAFNAIAGILGSIMGFFVLISGIGDIANTVTEYTNAK